MAVFFSFCCFEGLILVPLLYFPLDFVFRKMFFDVFCHFVDIIFAWIFIRTQWVIPYYVFSSFKKHLLQLYQQYLSHDLCISPAFASILNVQNPNQKRTFSACIFRFERFAILHLSALPSRVKIRKIFDDLLCVYITHFFVQQRSESSDFIMSSPN